MRIAIVTDIHHGPQSHTKDENFNALAALRGFVRTAEEEKADVLLDLGDHISDTKHESDHQRMTEVAEVLATFASKRIHLLGNHDVNNLSIEENEAIFRCSMKSAVHDLGEIRIIAWQPGVFSHRETAFAPTGDQLDWLVEALTEDNRPAIIATHVPLSGQSQLGNYYFQRNPYRATYPDHHRVRKAVEATGRAALWLSGHVHWNTLTTVANIPYVTIQSLSERFTTSPETACSHAILEIRDGRFSVDVAGNDPFYVRLPFRCSAERPWMEPKAPISETDRRREMELSNA